MGAEYFSSAVSQAKLSRSGRLPYYPQPKALVHLDNGHQIAFDEYGDLTGYPLFYFHDSGSSRLEAAFFDNSAKQFGLRLIAMDRPGIGLSSFYGKSDAESFAKDTISIADWLGIEQFGVISLGKGGIFGLTLAHRYPHRVSQFVSLAGVPGTVLSESRADSWLFNRVFELTPLLINLLVRCKFMLFREEPRKIQTRLLKHLADVDRSCLRTPGLRDALALDQQEALRQGCRGLALDLANCFRKLQFRLEDVEVPTTIWQGRADSLSQRADCEFMTSRMPSANYHLVPNAGHFFFLKSMDDVFSRLQGHKQSEQAMAA